MTPQQKRNRTIIERYGSHKNMLAGRDVRDLILGGYNGGIKKTKKGFATWEPQKLRRFTEEKQRDSMGKFVAKTETTTDSAQGTEEQADR